MENVVAAELGLDVSKSAGVYPDFASSLEQWEKTNQSWSGSTGFEFPTAVLFNAAGEEHGLSNSSELHFIIYY